MTVIARSCSWQVTLRRSNAHRLINLRPFGGQTCEVRSSAPLAADLRNRQRLRFKHRKECANNYCEPIVRGYIGEANESAIELVSKMPACAPAAFASLLRG
jgi:hypothetical protein